MSKAHIPQTLQEAVIYFADSENCRQFMVDMRWPDGKIQCPRCGGFDVAWLPNDKRFKCCKHDSPKFSLKVGTIFEDSPIPLRSGFRLCGWWRTAKMACLEWEIHRAIKVTQKSAWFMLQRARLAMQGDTVDTFGGEGGAAVEVDETYIGGLARNMHKDVRERKIKGRTGWQNRRVWFTGARQRRKEI